MVILKECYLQSVKDKALSCLLGSAVGDALFAPVEFMTPEAIKAKYGGPLREMVGGGWLNVRPGQHTDDTEMALCLARSIACYQNYYPQGALNNYIAWYQNDPIDIGGTTVAALSAAAKGKDLSLATEEHHRTNHSGGNGSIMRAAPLAVAFGLSPELLSEHARTDAALTHYEPLGREACDLYNLHLAETIYGEEYEKPKVSEQVEKAYNANIIDAEFLCDTKPGFVLTALAVGMASMLVADNVESDKNPFEEGLVWAGNLGGDTDTNGAVAGALLGARYGVHSIPERWLEVLDARKEITNIIDELLSVAESQSS
jgi:ADP-ribosyl-[dinitrogen reductase] hydrolase